MTTLYIAPGSCSFAAHVLVRELELPIEVQKVALLAADSPIHRINPLGKVPALEFDDGTVLTENSAILPYLADQKPEARLLGPVGSRERARVQSWLGFLNSELHTSLRPVNRPERFSDDAAHFDAIRAKGRRQVTALFEHIERSAEGLWLTGERFSVADAYLGVFLFWAERGKLLDWASLPKLSALFEAYRARPAVQVARQVEQAS
ncbi:glutathione S-transferase N-terminal domain-containing protein [Neisseriaceae bacterium JH1-16]|nr:glutathione S-transferase N-terminal domain-containing protein [Neisseriaceae bacterium JH1-16]